MRIKRNNWYGLYTIWTRSPLLFYCSFSCTEAAILHSFILRIYMSIRTIELSSIITRPVKNRIKIDFWIYCSKNPSIIMNEFRSKVSKILFIQAICVRKKSLFVSSLRSVCSCLVSFLLFFSFNFLYYYFPALIAILKNMRSVFCLSSSELWDDA